MTELASYSFKNDPDVPPHDHNKDLIVFDHECIFCSSFIRFVFAHDRSGRFLFTAAQSPLGQALYRHYGLDPTDLSTNLVIVDGSLHTKMDAFATAYALPRLSLELAYGRERDATSLGQCGIRSDCQEQVPLFWQIRDLPCAIQGIARACHWIALPRHERNLLVISGANRVETQSALR
jgi:hypothetical protein